MSNNKAASGKTGGEAQLKPRVVAPFWQVERQSAPKLLQQDLDCQVAIIGGGIAGLSVAWALTRQGQKPVVLDAGNIGEGSTGWCGGILSSSTTIDLQLMEAAFGHEQAQLLFKSLRDALLLCRQSFPQTDWQTGSSFYVAAKESHRQTLRSEMESKEKYNMPMRFWSQGAISGEFTGFAGALETKDEHAAHPIKILDNMAIAIQQAGGSIFEHSPVKDWRHDGEKFVVRVTGGRRVTAKHLIVCCGLSGSKNKTGLLGSYEKQLVPASGHILVTQPCEAVADLVQRTGVIALWDSLNLYHYVRYLADGRMLVGGEEAAGAIPSRALSGKNERIRHLWRWAQAHHGFKLPPVECAWKASLVIPADGLPVIASQDFGASKLVSVITDGLPFAMLIGQSVSRYLDAGDDWLVKLLSQSRPAPLSARILGLLPTTPLLRQPAYKAAFLALRLFDMV